MKKIVVLLTFIGLAFSCQKQKEPLKIGYSDWPGWIAWDIAISKGWFKEAGVDVDFSWFEYVPSMDAFASGNIDAVNMTNGDALVTGATGASNVMILVSDYSNGNDMIVAAPGIETMSDLKGKKVGLEVGFVEHLLLNKGLESVGLSESDVELVNVATHQTAQTLASGEVDAIAAWQPNSGEALKEVSGSKPIYTSANVPGLIYDCLAVSPASLSERRDDWAKVVKVWYRVVDFLADPANKAEALEIMSSRAGVTPKEYAYFMKGVKFLNINEAKRVFSKGDGLQSIYGSSKLVDKFNVSNKVYDKAQNIDSYIDPSITLEQ
ncbi:ABC transporter substrate-binding protein [Aquimarina agarilytica]|uniref:ABC transporter substrate-binding protein n=1 Tax=Aquimarina agarilytica TaxID=1087449 RepID=UPI0002887270|nr:ABC transporter substrate-binding protein [Aquimarina agarilytica]